VSEDLAAQQALVALELVIAAEDRAFSDFFSFSQKE
jgi:hypothetical protein